MNPAVVESVAIQSSSTQNLSAEWRFSLPEPKEFDTFSGLKPIEEFLPQLELHPWIGFRCGLIIPEPVESEPNFVDLEFRGSTDRWVPIDGLITRTLHFEISR